MKSIRDFAAEVARIERQIQATYRWFKRRGNGPKNSQTNSAKWAQLRRLEIQLENLLSEKGLIHG